MEKRILRFATVIVILLFPLALFAQNGKIVGKITDSKTGEGLMGANVLIEGTTLGAAAAMDGSFEIANVPPGTYTLKVTFMGYKAKSQQVQVTAGAKVTANFRLEQEILLGTAITILADRAKPRETPVAFTDVKSEDMEARLGSQDIPLVLNTTPSVYATMQGGGAGDARINVRGFNQRNVAVMINGVPVNDMENGWVYWSNWDGVGDATSSLQVQRGLSAINLATPSIGGTMNIITQPAAAKRGFKFKQELGNDGFLKSTLVANSGLIAGKYAFNAALVKKTGNGIIDKTWTDAWAYYFGASWQINKDNRVEIYALGAPQRHGQNLYKQNMAAYDQDFATSLTRKLNSTTTIYDYDLEALNKYHEMGRRFNQNWAPVDPSYTGKQFWNGKEHERYDPNFINERENFYHKPIVNLNWYTNLTEKLSLYSTVYYSGGTGGGTGTYGKLVRQSFEGPFDQKTGKFYYYGSPWRWDWDATIAINRDSTHAYIDKKEINKEAGESVGILRNSRNNQWTIGAISKANYKISDAMKFTAGVDWRTAEIEHFREIRDLLGGSYFMSTSNVFDDTQEKQTKKLGDKVDYFFTNTVDWIGFFGQTEYSSGPINAYAMAGYSTIKYTYTNHFRAADTLANGDPDLNSGELTAETNWISGFQVKGGAGYRISDNMDIFGNFGYVDRVPIFDDVINDRTGTMAEDPKNEKFISIEGGLNYWGMDGKFMLKSNVYYTNWRDKSLTVGVVNPDGSEGIIFIQGVDLLHKGIEFEAAFQPMSLFRVDAAASFGNWKYTDDVTGVYKDYSLGPGQEEVEKTYYIKNLKSGDAPQTQLSVVGSIFPIQDLMGQVVFRYYANHYANWNAQTRTDPDDRAQSWKAPNYYVMDLHVNYKLPFDFGGVKLKLFAHVFNVLDAIYIQDATDNSKYNAWDKDHDADDAEVFFGLPRTFNVGLTVTY